MLIALYVYLSIGALIWVAAVSVGAAAGDLIKPLNAILTLPLSAVLWLPIAIAIAIAIADCCRKDKTP